MQSLVRRRGRRHIYERRGHDMTQEEERRQNEINKKQEKIGMKEKADRTGKRGEEAKKDGKEKRTKR